MIRLTAARLTPSSDGMAQPGSGAISSPTHLDCAAPGRGESAHAPIHLHSTSPQACEPSARATGEFCWLGKGKIPSGLDLRLRGWTLSGRSTSAGLPQLLLAGSLAAEEWVDLVAPANVALRRMVLLLRYDEAEDRARLLRLGFGDVVGSEASLAEIEARAQRVAMQADLLPRSRKVGSLRLDLASRDAFVGDRSLGLHPREFSLMWRLADSPGEPMGKDQLLRDVWRLGFLPETNSLAVHVSRLRHKLAVAGLEGMVRTASAGGYYIGACQPVLRKVAVRQ